ncbi:MAG: hypothetical protein GX493_08765 [Firmicutes bacterium]|nr:hypothetical protein [Bacillota bacterium]
MDHPSCSLEVETRLHFADREEAFRLLPFLRSCRWTEIEWETSFWGEELFLAGFLLRLAQGGPSGGPYEYSLGWKGPDRGKVVNIREEIEEEITEGLIDSRILAMLGAPGRRLRREEVAAVLEELGHARFMSFSRRSLLGVDPAYGFKLKLMSCPILRWPLLLEIEKSAATWEEARAAEKAIISFLEGHGLLDRLVREEPPTLLYEVMKG